MWSPMGVGNLISSYRRHPKSIWISMGVEMLISPYPCIIWPLWTGRVNLKVDFFIPSYTCGQSKSVWSSMGVGKFTVYHSISSYLSGHAVSIWSLGILISSYPFEAPCRWLFGYHLALVQIHRQIWSSMGVGIPSYRTLLHTLCQFEVPWGGNSDIIFLSTWQINFQLHGVGNLYHLTFVDNPCQFKIPWGGKFWYQFALLNALCHFVVPWGWENWFHLALVHIAPQFVVPRGGFDIILPLWTIQVNLKFHGGGNFEIILPVCTFPVNL